MTTTCQDIQEAIEAAIYYAEGTRNDQFARDCYDDAVAVGLIQPARKRRRRKTVWTRRHRKSRRR